MTTDDIIHKIKGLLALAGNNPSEEEASTALMMARKLMLRYNIDEGDLNQSAEHNPAEYGDKKDMSADYIRILGSAIRDMVGVTLIYWSDGKFAFVGRPINIQFGEQLMTFLADQIEALYKIHLPRGMSKSERAKYRRDFKRLCAYRISQRAADLKAADAKTSDGTALIVIEDKLNDEIEELLKKKGVKTRKTRTKLDINSRGGRDGFSAGNSAALKPAIKG